MALLPKQYKYNQLKIFDNVIESSIADRESLSLTKTWEDTGLHLKNDLILEIGCGRGAFTHALARRHSDRTVIGLDIKGSRIYTGAVMAKKENLANALFLRMRAEFLGYFFPAQSVSEIWITFPDPHIKNRRKNFSKRLTAPDFLASYRYILKENGKIHLKTDNDLLFEYTMQVVRDQGGSILLSERDLYSSELSADTVLEKTEYEERFLREDKKIGYIQFTL